ncbi:MAG: hypothetical protein JSU05_07215, partial [Bacteroidetes bacterium]|nr:hypothetical protein [Bacteroidota bacterium]
MNSRYIRSLQYWLTFAASFTITISLVRVYEYFAVASKYFLAHAGQFEIAGLLYDLWACLVYSFFLLILYILISLFSQKAANIVFHALNILFIILSLSLIIVFSERTRPFDHEFFTRNAADSWLTTKQMLTSGVQVYVPFFIYITLYLLFYYFVFKKIHFRKWQLITCIMLSLLSVLFIQRAIPSAGNFRQVAAYYLESNKFSYWVNDCYSYFRAKDKFNAAKLNNKELAEAIAFYQQNHPFEFTNPEYPLLHKNNSKDVLGNFFNLQHTPPNIVILVVEGLSRDFSGNKAYATSFTPFLDSLSAKSLVWDNFLSTAPGT